MEKEEYLTVVGLDDKKRIEDIKKKELIAETKLNKEVAIVSTEEFKKRTLKKLDSLYFFVLCILAELFALLCLFIILIMWG